MSCSENSVFARLRSRTDRFLASPFYMIAVMVLSMAAHLLSLEVLFYTVLVLVAIYAAVFGKDLLPLTPLFLFCYITPSLKNNPGRNAQSVFSGTTGVYLAVLAVLLAAAALWYIIRNRKAFFQVKRTLLPGLLALSAAYLLSGIGSENYLNVLPRNLLFAGMQAASLLVPYCLLSGGVKWDDARRDYLAWIGFTAGAAVLLQVLNCYATCNVVENGVIIRERIYTGWGMYNNMGFVLAMAIPFAFYLASKYRRGWIGTVVGSVFWVGVLLTCSRTSLIVATVIYCLCVFLMLHYARNRKHNTIALIIVLLVIGVSLLLFRNLLLHLFSGFLDKGMDPSSRDVFFREGMKIFSKAPVLGSSFYASGYTPWDFSNVDAFSSLIPPRWHSTPLQLLVSCGAVGIVAYSFHRYQTVRLFIRNRQKETVFMGCALGVLLLCSLLDCHFFNLGPAIFYSAALAFAEFGQPNTST